jgi:DNA-binding response OmpR family regulator
MTRAAEASRRKARPVVFVVEDEALIREMLEWHLGRGYRVRAFADGSEALRALAQATPDVLLADLGLPDLAGERLAARARTTPAPPIVVLMSGDQQRLEQARGQADATIEKPFALEELLEILEACLAARDASRRAEPS